MARVRLWLLLLMVLLVPFPTVEAQRPRPGVGCVAITEIDGVPIVSCARGIKFSNGAVTDNGDGTVTVMTGAGGGGDFSSNTAVSVIGEVVVFSDVNGKTGKRATGTGVASLTSGVLGAFTTSAGLAGLLSDETGSGALVFANTPTLIAPLLGTPTSGVATNLTGLPLTTGITGILGITNGGTGLATLTAHSLYVGAGTSVPVALGSATNGQIPIGSTGNDPVLAALAATSPITNTVGAGTSTIACATCTTSGAALTNHAPVIGVGSQGEKTTAALTNGQLLIGSTGADPVPASLTAGTNITITPSAGGILIDATAGAGGYAVVQDEGSNLTARTTLNFAGAGVTCADGASKTTCTIPGGSGSPGAPDTSIQFNSGGVFTGDSGLVINPTVLNIVHTAFKGGYGIDSYNTYGSADVGEVGGAIFTGALGNASGPATWLTGVLGEGRSLAAGGVTTLSGVSGRAINSGVGTTVAAAALYARTNIKSAGTISTNYGLYLEDQSSVGGVNYQIFSAGMGPSVLSGPLSAASLATTAASPLLLTNGMQVTVALTSQTVGGTTLTLPNFASVADEFTFKTKAQTMSNKTFVTPVLGVASATSLATSAASPLLLTNGQLVTVALTSQTVGGTTLTIPDFASVADEFTFKTKAQTLSNKTFVAPALGTPASGVLTNATGLPTAGLVAGAVTYAKMQDISGASMLLGRGSAGGPGSPQEITLGTNLSMSGTTLNATGGGSGGTAGAPLYVQTADHAAVTSGSETSIIGSGAGSLTIPAAWFTAAGTVLDVRFSGVYSTGAVPGTLNLKLKLGSTVVAQTGAFTPLISVTNGVYSVRLRLIARTVGASGTLFVTEIAPFTGATLTPGDTIFSNPTLGTAVVVDTTATQVVDLTATWGTAATNSITGQTFEMVGPGSAVSSVFGRTGAVVAVSGDYTAAQVTNAVATTRTLTGGAGIAAIGDLSADRTIATASGEADFLASGALTCGAATQGKMQVHTTPLQYCDNAATPTLRYGAYGDSAGAALTGDSATAFFPSGTLEAAIGGTGNSSYTKGDLTVASASTTLTKLAVGANGQALVADSTQSTGVKWVDTSIDPALFVMREEFPPTGLAANVIGTHSWTAKTVGGSPTVTNRDGAYPHLGVFRITTSGTIAQGGALQLDGNTGINMLGDLGTNTNWDLYWIFSIATSTANVRARLGIATAGAVAQPAGGFWVRWDTNAGDTTTFFLCRRSASDTENCTASTIAIDTGWHKVRIRSTVAGTVSLSVDGETEICFTSAGSGCANVSQAIPTALMAPMAIMVTDANAAKVLDLDYFGFRAIVTGR